MLIKKNIFFFLLLLPLSFTFPQYGLDKDMKTFFEKSNFLESPNYKESINYFKQFEKQSEYCKFLSMGTSPQGREINYLIVSKDKYFTPQEAKRSGKSILFINNGIHSGEIEGKDACMLLVRDLLSNKDKNKFLDSIILIIVPILSVDGHERSSKFSRINQNGPLEMCWRTTAQNLNLNRDWVKADAPEMQYLLKLFSLWLPDFFIDTHTTDGADYQYTVTYGIEKFAHVEKNLAEFTKQSFIPYLENDVQKRGYLIAPYVGFKDGEPQNGIYDWVGVPRLSNGYGAAQNRLTLLIETHMMKPYKERVFATLATIESVINYLYLNNSWVKQLNSLSDENTIKTYGKPNEYFPVAFKLSDKKKDFQYKGFKVIRDSSTISGGLKIKYTNAKETITIPYYYELNPIDSVLPPDFYIIPLEYSLITERLKLHGVKVDVLKQDTIFKVTKYKFKNIKFSEIPYEGHQSVTCEYDEINDISEKIKSGSLIVKTDQRTARIILWALEPKSSDSFLRWGFMNSIFEKKEYFEPYVMEEAALKMIKENPSLEKEFKERLNNDEKFRNNPYQRLNFFYERSPFFDQKLNIYPIFRVEYSN